MNNISKHDTESVRYQKWDVEILPVYIYEKSEEGHERVRKYNKVFSINNVQLSGLAVSNIISFPKNLSRAEHNVFLHVQKNLILWNAPKKYYVQ